MKKANLSGMSFPNLITLFNDSGYVEVFPKEKEVQYLPSKNKFSLYEKTRKIPFIRGFTSIIDMMIKLVDYLWNKKRILFGVIFIVIYLIFSPNQEEKVKSFWDYYIGFGLWMFIVSLLFLATKNHSAEHKVISAYDSNQDLSIKNIEKQPKENRRCGTVLVMWFLTLKLFIYTITGIDEGLFDLLVIFPIAYELFLLARRKGFIGNVFYSVGWLGQKITTRKPDKNLLLIARKGMRLLLDKGGYKYNV